MLCVILSMVDSPEDKRKIEQLYEEYHRYMYAVAYHILHHHEDAEDAVLASWEKMIRHLDKIKEIVCKETKSFIVIIVERTAIDLYRKNKRRGKRETLLDEVETLPFYATKDSGIEEIEVSLWLRNLPKKYSEPAILYYVNGFSQKEIADLMGIKENAVTMRLHRARKMLEEGWNEYERS